MRRYSIYMLVLLTAVLASCNEGAGPLGNVQVSFATRSPAVTPSAPRAAGLAPSDDTLQDGTNTLVITQAEIVLREIQFERLDIADCDAAGSGEGCQDIELGPVLVDLPLTAGADQRFAAPIPVGTYVEVEFDIHKVSKDGQEDAVLRQQHPTFPVETSIRIQGTFNGQPFDFRTDLDVEQELRLVPPLVVADATMSTNVTILVGLDGWFRALDGTLVDPDSGNKGGANESLITENIKKSIEAFEDRDADGKR